jgi:hypothetical protein
MGKGQFKLLCQECCSGGYWDFFSVLKSIMSGAVCCSGGYWDCLFFSVFFIKSILFLGPTTASCYYFNTQLPSMVFKVLISGLFFIGLAYQARQGYCVYIHSRVYSSFRDFYRPLGNNNNNRSIYFYMRIFERLYFGLCWNLRLVIIEL